MTCTESAKIIGTEELLEIMNEECTNPTVERLMFIETKGNEKKPGKIFPCYAKAWNGPADANVQISPEFQFMMDILQSNNGNFGMVEVVISSKEFEVTKRLWDKPPTKGLRDETPWVSVGEGVS